MGEENVIQGKPEHAAKGTNQEKKREGKQNAHHKHKHPCSSSSGSHPGGGGQGPGGGGVEEGEGVREGQEGWGPG